MEDRSTTPTDPAAKAKGPRGGARWSRDGVESSRWSLPPAVPTGARVRARLARFGAPRHADNEALEPLLRTVRRTHPKADVSIIQRAYTLAERVHEGQMRKSGDAYITHPLSVATILAEIGMPPVTLAAALLHDTVEDTDYTLEDLRRDFGDEIAILVDGVTKLDKVEYGDAAQAETVRKMILAVSKHVHVLLIKLADRLHNARTWKYVSAASAERKAKETLEIYAPLAHRLGLNTIKWELEDLSFQVLYPKVYDEIVRLVADRAPEREEQLRVVKELITADLKEAGIPAVVSGRPKHYYSVYQKMIVRGRDFEDIHDLVAVRVLVDSERDCYAVLGAMHARFHPIQGRFKDYIASPKFNFYQSLHTTVIGPRGKPVEIQIRTHDMHRRAEYGVAAHWKYKSAGGRGGAAAPLDELSWLRPILDWQRETSDPKDFLDSLRYEINADEVFTFTPKGGAITLPKGSTPIDFAYAVHTEVGHYCIGARVNGRLVPLDTVLDNGDQVEILTSRADGAGPSRDWLDVAKSPRALSKIRQWFTKERREESIERGKESIVKAMRRRRLPLQRLMTAERLADVATGLHYADVDALYAAVGENHLSAQALVDRLVDSVGGEEGATEDLAEATLPGRRTRVHSSGDPGIVVGDGVTGIWTKLAQCCTPVPGDAIIGFTTRSHGVSVHRRDCVNAELLADHPERITPVGWADGGDTADGRTFRVQVQITALNRKSLLADITKALADEKIDIITANISTKTDRQARSSFVFDMGDPSHLEHVLRKLRSVDHVIEVERVTGRRRPGVAADA